MIYPSPAVLPDDCPRVDSFYGQTNQIGGHLAGTLGRKTGSGVSALQRLAEGITVAFGGTTVALGNSVRYSERVLRLESTKRLSGRKWGRAPRKKATMPHPAIRDQNGESNWVEPPDSSVRRDLP